MLQVITYWLSWGMDSNDSHNPFRGSVALNWNTSKYRSTWFGLFQTINAVYSPSTITSLYPSYPLYPFYVRMPFYMFV